ncbi:MAG TPA: inositol monophosphatase family protein, partial [Gammaproteobacteria bacterium]|nr:inositol monophosphatase family protein [Gammaproteobacteria bacterium]
MSALLNIAVRAARRGGDLIVRNMDRLDSLQINTKQANDYVSEVDTLVEADIIETVRRSYPDHAFLGEESGQHKGQAKNTDDVTWIIDPLDGTTNFLHGFPVFAVSLAVKVRGRLEHGVVYDPLRQEMFTASRGSGAQLDGRRIRVSSRRSFDGALLGTGFPYSNMERIDQYLAMFKSLAQKTAGLRRPGAASLDLAYVAAGRLDGFFELGLKPWDMAAGVLLIQEAGGLVSDFAGAAHYMDSGDI